MRIDFAYINYAHGGARDGSAGDIGRDRQFEGLVRLLGDDGRWPDIAVMGEAEGYEFGGGAGLYGAASALSEASGRGYLPMLGTLPREWGPIGPAVFVDAQKVRVHHFFSGREPDFYARNRNLLVASVAGSSERFRVVGTHGDTYAPDLRLHDAMVFRRYADPDVPAVVLGDWFGALSGPDAHGDFETYEHYRQFVARTVWRHGPAQASGEYVLDTRPRDYLCGWWDPETQQRAGGIGFHDVAELAGVRDPTNFPQPNGRRCTAIDGAVINQPWVDALVRESVRVHEPADPGHPDSDHKRLSFTIEV